MRGDSLKRKEVINWRTSPTALSTPGSFGATKTKIRLPPLSRAMDVSPPLASPRVTLQSTV